jgi:hypothetical protein
MVTATVVRFAATAWAAVGSATRATAAMAAAIDLKREVIRNPLKKGMNLWIKAIEKD